MSVFDLFNYGIIKIKKNILDIVFLQPSLEAP